MGRGVVKKKQFCTFYLGERLYGFPVEEVQEVIHEQTITHVPLAPAVVRGLINLRGKIVTVIDLQKKLGLDAEQPASPEMNLVVRNDESTVSFLVGPVGDVVTVEKAAFEELPEPLRGESPKAVVGVYKLPHGLLHVLDAQFSAQIEEVKTRALRE
jgi:purine-binding chemotaxis protein CheW